ncbi:unnamed protein product [Phytophthora fragariaefolia]|uniref:Unnamed protein product n=1 Tax=Phytophthora fragariaefolia TaxID=1490495 RepID=A0A9W6XK14_9STRA|nr:unnamed protein product [Phytophthora fragariaefolia]
MNILVSESQYQRDFISRSLRNSWISNHRCRGTFLFDESIMCTGIHGVTSLNVIDLHQLRRIDGDNETTFSDKGEDGAEGARGSTADPELPAVERLDRFRIPMNSVITAIAAHPNKHMVICGGEHLKLQLMAPMGQRVEETKIDEKIASKQETVNGVVSS